MGGPSGHAIISKCPEDILGISRSNVLGRALVKRVELVSSECTQCIPAVHPRDSRGKHPRYIPPGMYTGYPRAKSPGHSRWYSCSTYVKNRLKPSPVYIKICTEDDVRMKTYVACIFSTNRRRMILCEIHENFKNILHIPNICLLHETK